MCLTFERLFRANRKHKSLCWAPTQNLDNFLVGQIYLNSFNRQIFKQISVWPTKIVSLSIAVYIFQNDILDERS